MLSQHLPSCFTDSYHNFHLSNFTTKIRRIPSHKDLEKSTHLLLLDCLEIFSWSAPSSEFTVACYLSRTLCSQNTGFLVVHIYIFISPHTHVSWMHVTNSALVFPSFSSHRFCVVLLDVNIDNIKKEAVLTHQFRLRGWPDDLVEFTKEPRQAHIPRDAILLLHQQVDLVSLLHLDHNKHSRETWGTQLWALQHWLLAYLAELHLVSNTRLH